MHDLSIITTLAGALAAALAFGWLTQRIGLSPLVGYLLAGIAVGPYTPGFVADPRLASQLAEIGVILLMFGVGLHFHPEELFRVWRVAVPGAVAQSVAATLLGWMVAVAFGWSHVSGVVLGVSLAVASTVVLMRMLSEQARLNSADGHAALGWLIVQDLFAVVALVVLPAFAIDTASEPNIAFSILWALGKVAAFAALVWLLGPWLISPLLERMARTRSAELFTLAVFVLALSIAGVAAAVFEVSVALGAFFGGLVVAQSRVGHQAAADMLPFRDVFSALFFVSVGMLFDPSFVLGNPGIVLAALAVILIANPIVALAIVLVLRHPLRTALTVAVGLAQIGEFSFILAGLGESLRVLPQAGFNVVVASALISIAVNPLLFKAEPWLERRLAVLRPERQVRKAIPIEQAVEIIVIGYGETGRKLCGLLRSEGAIFAVIDKDLNQVEVAEAQGMLSVFGNAGNPDLLKAAGAAGARALVLTSSTLADRMRVCLAARQINSRIRIISRSSSPGERAWLEEFGVSWVVDEAMEIGTALHGALKRAASTDKDS